MNDDESADQARILWHDLGRFANNPFTALILVPLLLLVFDEQIKGSRTLVLDSVMMSLAVALGAALGRYYESRVSWRRGQLLPTPTVFKGSLGEDVDIIRLNASLRAWTPQLLDFASGRLRRWIRLNPDCYYVGVRPGGFMLASSAVAGTAAIVAARVHAEENGALSIDASHPPGSGQVVVLVDLQLKSGTTIGSIIDKFFAESEIRVLVGLLGNMEFTKDYSSGSMISDAMKPRNELQRWREVAGRISVAAFASSNHFGAPWR